MLTKLVNGERVECSPLEEKLIREEWAANARKAAEEAAKPKPPTLEEKLEQQEQRIAMLEAMVEDLTLRPQ